MRKLRQADFVKLPPIAHFLIAAAVQTSVLLATQGLISNHTEKLVTGLAAIWMPIAYLLLVGLYRLAHARETAARILNSQPSEPRLTP